jgi:hypothetical protein
MIGCLGFEVIPKGTSRIGATSIGEGEARAFITDTYVQPRTTG